MRLFLVVTTVHERTQKEHTSGTGALHRAHTLMHLGVGAGGSLVGLLHEAYRLPRVLDLRL